MGPTPDSAPRMDLTRTWAVLVALSLASTALAGLDSLAQVAQAAILLLAFAKAHLILKAYLGLGRIPQVLRGFDVVLALVMAAMLALTLAA